MILQLLLAMLAGWIQRHQQQVITYLQEENRVLKAQLGGRRLRLTDTERRRLATLAHPLRRKRLKAVATLVTPETLLRWYQRLISQKFDGSTQRQRCCRKVAFEAICAMVSPGDLWYAEKESNDGDQLQGGPFPTRYHSHGRALVCGVSLKLSTCRRVVGGAWGPDRPRDYPALGREI